ncbi:pyrroloquinoline quinone precursor peptide PqqA [Lampropedia cohaerens]|nr:pyrroloquinoline quinone precursor peptide PqqA [Lampropedia cohaerens]
MKIMTPLHDFMDEKVDPPTDNAAAPTQSMFRCAPGNGAGRSFSRRSIMQWEKPAAQNLRLGFEITMYVFNR